MRSLKPRSLRISEGSLNQLRTEMKIANESVATWKERFIDKRIKQKAINVWKSAVHGSSDFTTNILVNSSIKSRQLYKSLQRWSIFVIRKRENSSLDRIMYSWKSRKLVFNAFSKLKLKREFNLRLSSLRMRVKLLLLRKPLASKIRLFKWWRVQIIRRRLRLLRFWNRWKRLVKSFMWLRKFSSDKLRDAFLRLKRRSKWPAVVKFHYRHAGKRVLASFSHWKSLNTFLKSVNRIGSNYVMKKIWELVIPRLYALSIATRKSRTAQLKCTKFLVNKYLSVWRAKYKLPYKTSAMLGAMTKASAQRGLRALGLNVCNRKLSRRANSISSITNLNKAWRIFITRLSALKRRALLDSTIKNHTRSQFQMKAMNRFISFTYSRYNEQRDLSTSNKYFKQRAARKLFIIWRLRLLDSRKYSRIKKTSDKYREIKSDERRALERLRNWAFERKRCSVGLKRAAIMGYYNTPFGRWRYWLSLQRLYGNSLKASNTNASLNSMLHARKHQLRQTFTTFRRRLENIQKYRNSQYLRSSIGYLHFRTTLQEQNMLLWRLSVLKRIFRRRVIRSHRLLRALRHWFEKCYASRKQTISIHRSVLRHTMKAFDSAMAVWSSYTCKRLSLKRRYRVYRKMHPKPLLNRLRRIFTVWSCSCMQRASRNARIYHLYRGAVLRQCLESWEKLFFVRRSLRRSFQKLKELKDRAAKLWEHTRLRYQYRSAKLWQMNTVASKISTASASDLLAHVDEGHMVRIRLRSYIDSVMHKSSSSREFFSRSLARRLFYKWKVIAITQRLERIAYKKAIEATFNRAVKYSQSVHNRQALLTKRVFIAWKTHCRSIENATRRIRLRVEGMKFFQRWRNAIREHLVHKHIRQPALTNLIRITNKPSKFPSSTSRSLKRNPSSSLSMAIGPDITSIGRIRSKSAAPSQSVRSITPPSSKRQHLLTLSQSLDLTASSSGKSIKKPSDSSSPLTASSDDQSVDSLSHEVISNTENALLTPRLAKSLQSKIHSKPSRQTRLSESQDKSLPPLPATVNLFWSPSTIDPSGGESSYLSQFTRRLSQK